MKKAEQQQDSPVDKLTPELVRQSFYDNFMDLFTRHITEPTTKEEFPDLGRDDFFANFEKSEVLDIRNSSPVIGVCHLWGLPRSALLGERENATIKITSRGKNGWFGELSGRMVISQHQTLEEKQKNKGWSLFSFGRKKEQE